MKVIFSVKTGLLSLLVITAIALMPNKASAHCFIGCCVAVTAIHFQTQAIISNEHRHLRDEVFGESAGILPFPDVPDPPVGFFRIQHYERYLIETVFKTLIQPAMMMMTEQLVTVAMEQMFIIGTFFDAKQQLKAQMKFQELAARAHKDYHPSFGMCEFGSTMRSLGASDFKGDLSAMLLNRRFMDRQLGTNDSIGSFSPDNDRASDQLIIGQRQIYNRLGYFLNNTCDDNDINRILAPAGSFFGNLTSDQTGLYLCDDTVPIRAWSNRDIDWNNTVMTPRTINVDYSLPGMSDNNRLFEMSNLLYGHEVFSRPDGSLLNYEQNQNVFLDSRAVTAKRSVAQHSFNSIVGLKSRGTSQYHPGHAEYSSEETSEFMRFFLVALGFDFADRPGYHRYMFNKGELYEDGMLLEEDQISYYGQMEVLAKKVYQRPEFYTELYDKPANVKRKSAAMQAIKLMLERDIFDSQIRSEAILSMILELKIVDEQRAIENELGLLKERTR